MHTPVIPTPPESLVPSHRIATWLIENIDKFLADLGLASNRTISEIVYVAAIAAVAVVVGLTIKFICLTIARKIVALRHTAIAQQLLDRHTLEKCAHIVPPLVFMGMIPFAFTSGSTALWWILRITGIYALIAFGIGLNSILSFIFFRYDERENTRNLPLKGILNVAEGIVWIIVTILAVSVLIDKSPAALLAGLGAFAAALMLIFKDSILGFVAGIQMSQNDMLHVGDWIVVPGTPANGTVLDVSLSTVKIQNFDNTIVTVPPYTLVSGAFQNWRGMSLSGVRRIKQSFTIDYDGIGQLTPEILDRVTTKYPILKPYTDAIVKGEPANGSWSVEGGLRGMNGTLETNLGLFRAYLCAYLMQNPHISSDHRILVQLLDPTIYGIPLEIWCWSNTTDWNAYESIQSAVMEHLTAVVADFGLVIYSAGNDTVELTGPGAGSSSPATKQDNADSKQAAQNDNSTK